MRGVSRPRQVPRTYPVTLIPMHVDPVQAPVFGERRVFPPGYAPKAARRKRSTASRLALHRLEKGICKKLARYSSDGPREIAKVQECSLAVSQVSTFWSLVMTKENLFAGHLYLGNPDAVAFGETYTF